MCVYVCMVLRLEYKQAVRPHASSLMIQSAHFLSLSSVVIESMSGVVMSTANNEFSCFCPASVCCGLADLL